MNNLKQLQLPSGTVLGNTDSFPVSMARSESKIFNTPIQIAIPTLYFYVMSTIPGNIRVSARLHYLDKTVTEQVKLRMQMDQEMQGTVPSKSGRDRCIC